MFKRKILSIMLCAFMLFSVISVGLIGSTSAKTVNGYSELVSLTFDGNAPYGMPVHRQLSAIAYENGYAMLKNNASRGGTGYIGKDGTVGATPVTQSSSADARAEAKANLFLCEAGKTYRLKFDYKYLAGSGGTTKGVTVWLVPDPTASSISSYNLADRATLIESQPASVKIADTATVITEDTAWNTAYYTFTVNDDQTDGVAIGIHPGYSTSYASILAIDNLTVSEVTSIEYNESRLHTMDDATNDAFTNASGCDTDNTALVDNYDEEHGSVLKIVGGNHARLSFNSDLNDINIKKDRKYYISFDAKSETDGAVLNTVLGRTGSNTLYCRYFMTGYKYFDAGTKYYIDGTQCATAKSFLLSTDWRHYGIVLDTSDSELIANIDSQSSTFWTSTTTFLFGVTNATAYFDNVQVIEIQDTPAAVANEEKLSAAGSIRIEKTAENNNGVYQSAGLRFRGIIDNKIKDTADEIGFLVAPSLAVANDSDWYKFENGLNPIVRTGVCYQKDVKDIVYDESTMQTAYQMILTGLSTEDGKTAYIQRFSAALYVKSGDSYTYYALGESSFNQVAATYRVMNIDFDDPVKNEELLEIDDSWKTHPQDYKLIAFTFDDGPTATDGTDGGNNQNKIINTLNKYGGAGTLFVIGNRVNTYGVGQLEYAVEKGFEIASHTMTHTNINSTYLESRPDYTAQDYIDEQIKPFNDLLREKMGITPKFLRASNGTCPDQVIEAAATMNMPLVFGNQDENGNTVSLKDYDSSTTAQYIYNQVISSAYDGKVVLMHGTSAATAEALDDICKTLYMQGYRFVTLSELFEYKLKVTDMSQVDVANSFGGSAGIYDIDDVKLKYYNEDQWFLHPEDYKLLAFTFDDGPVYSEVGDNAVTKVIDAFEDYHGAATFFFTGRSLATYGTTIPQYALSKGHELANHSYGHTTLSTIADDKDATIAEIKDVNDWYKNNMNYTCKWFRGAGFSQNDYMWDYLDSIGMPAINRAAGLGSDYSGGTSTADDIIAHIRSLELANGSIILGHSTNSKNVTPDALAVLLPELYAQGYRFCTLSQLIELQGVDYEDLPTDQYIKKVSVVDGVVSYN